MAGATIACIGMGAAAAAAIACSAAAAAFLLGAYAPQPVWPPPPQQQQQQQHSPVGPAASPLPAWLSQPPTQAWVLLQACG
jgi:hypothetical protein